MVPIRVARTAVGTSWPNHPTPGRCYQKPLFGAPIPLESRSKWLDCNFIQRKFCNVFFWWKLLLSFFLLQKLQKPWLTSQIQWILLVLVKGGRWHIILQLAVYTTYIPLIVLAFWGLYATYHLLREPETTIDKSRETFTNVDHLPFPSHPDCLISWPCTCGSFSVTPIGLFRVGSLKKLHKYLHIWN